MNCVSPTARKKKSRTGFTLIELLTVIAIIGVLAAILIPTVSAVRKKANQVKSVSNLRQLGGAMRMFAADNRDYLPAANYNTSNSGGGSWDEVILSYLGYQLKDDGYVAPAAEAVFFHPGDQAAAHPERARRSYAMPRGNVTQKWIGLHTTSRPFLRRGTKISQVTTPSRVILLTTRRNNENNSFVGQWTFSNIDSVQDQIVTPEVSHKLNGNGTLEFLFVDGSVKVMRPEETWGKDQFGTAASPRGFWPIH